MNELAKRIAALSPEQRQLFEQRLKQQKSIPLTIPRRQIGNTLPLSFDQERIWFFEQLEPDTCLYNIPFAVQLTGELNAIALQQSFAAIMQRHESLRTTFGIQDGQPIQIVHAVLDCPLAVIELGDRSESAIHSLLRQEAQRPFNLGQEALLRAVLWRIHPTQHILLVVLHHLIADGWSRGVFIEELAAFYQAFDRQTSVALPELPVQYGDVVLWQRETTRETTRPQLAYWQKQLQDLPLLNLPIDRPRPATQTFNGKKQSVQLSASLTQRLKALSQQEGVTLFMTLLTAFNLLLHYYTGQDDVVVGTDVANRNRTETERLIGLFVNQLVLRTDLSGHPTVRQLLQRVKQTTVDAYAHQDLPFNTLVEALNPDRDLSRSPLFQVKFVLQNAPVPPLALSDLTVTPLDEIDTQTATLDLFLAFTETEQGLAGSLEYNTDLFEAATIQRLFGHFQTLLEQIVIAPDRHLSDFCLLTEAEREQIMLWNQTERQFACLEHCSTLTELFEAQVKQTPDAVAAIFEHQSLTYRELNQRANQLAHHLRSLGVAPEVLVGVEMERSLNLVIALLGILKAGGAYLPLDPSYPQERLSLMLEDAQVSVLLTQIQNPSRQAQCIDLDRDWHEIAQHPETNPVHTATADNLAYVIYTSGSTGKPKGVMNTHRGICNRLAWMQDAYQIGESDRVLQKTPISFDVSVWEFFWTLISGATIVLARPEGHRDSAYLAELIAAQQITTLHFVPSMLRLFLTEAKLDRCHHLRRVICSGEALPVDLQQQFFDRLPSVELHNLYGPTEAAIDVTAWTCQDAHQAQDSHQAQDVHQPLRPTVPIGKPIANLQIYLLNQYLQPVPIGVPGELHIGGIGLARGYLNRPDLTHEKFISHSIQGLTSGISAGEPRCLYKTGDLACYRPDGAIEFLGRLDHQVKLRGFRIEPGEIEAVLSQHPAVREQVVLVRAGLGERGMQLVAYIVPIPEAAPDLIAQLRDWLKARLPEYMVPAAFVTLAALPLTPNGKLDRNSLPAPTGEDSVRSQLVLPRTPLEKQLAQIWSQILGIETIGIHDRFFELGGHSLLATQVISRVRESMGMDVSLRQMFAFPTIAEFAAQLEPSSAASVSPLQRLEQRHHLPLSFAQQRLWFLQQLAPDDLSYHGAAAIQLKGRLNVAALENSLNAIVQRHEVLRTQFAIEAGHPVQVILPTLKLPWAIVDLREQPDPAAAIHQWQQDATQHRFDLTQAPLFQLTLLRLADDEHTLLLTLHHIISDAWSIGVFLQELSALYAAFVQGQASPLPDLPIQYADFAVWQRLQEEKLASQLTYWKQQFQKIPAPLKFAIAPPNSAASSQGARYPLAFSHRLTSALKALSQENDVTLFMLLLAGFNALLHYATQQTDIAVGSPIANRNRREIEGLMGFFVNTLVLRTDLSGDPSFRDLVLRVRETALAAYAHQDLPFERLVTELQVDRQLGQSPLFQVWFVLQNVPMPIRELPDLQLTLSDLETGVVRHDLKLDLTETSTGLEGFFEYKTSRFEPIAITRLATLYQTLWETVIAQPDLRLSQLVQVLFETEQQQQRQAEQAFRDNRRQKLKGFLSQKSDRSVSQN